MVLAVKLMFILVNLWIISIYERANTVFCCKRIREADGDKLKMRQSFQISRETWNQIEIQFYIIILYTPDTQYAFTMIQTTASQS